MASSSPSFLASLLIVWSVFCIFNACNARSEGGMGFSMKLMHRDSPRSPRYQPYLTSEDRIRAMIDRSIARARHISSIISGTSNYYSDDDDSTDHGYYSGGGGGVYTSIASSPSSAPAPSPSNVHTRVIPNGGDYLMELEIGTPPVKIVAIADTGSDLVWVQCLPCDECYNQTDPIFDPRKSSTFNGSAVSCDDKLCRSLFFPDCNKNNQCVYGIEYGDGSGTSGTLVKDTFTLPSGDSNKAASASFPGVVFGCSNDSGGSFDVTDDGLIGLGGGPLSLVSQLDSSDRGRFSYCLVPFTENATSTLQLGDNADVSGPGLVTIKMDRHKTFYFIRLLSVAVGGDTIPIDDARTSIIADSGTTLTYIPNSTLSGLIDGLSKMVNLTRTHDPQEYLPLCYSHPANASTYPFPNITFTFDKPWGPKDVAPVLLTPVQTFLQVSDDVVCLAMHDNTDVGLSIFGNIAQQNLHVGIDLHTNVLSLAPADCSKF